MSNQVLETTPSVPVPALEGPARSFWQVARRAFFRRVLHWVACVWIGALLIVAVIVPFLANGRPYVATVDGQKIYPLFRALTRVDLIVLLVAAAALLCLAILPLIPKRDNRVTGASPRRWFVFAMMVLALAGSLAVFLKKKEYNDLLRREDYMQLTPDYTVSGTVFPPIPWGFDDAEYPPPNLKRAAKATWILGHNDLPPGSPGHLLGTDSSGRDVLARAMWSARIVFAIGLISQLIALAIGVSYGALMGYFGGAVDILGNRFMEIVESVPTFFLIIMFVATFGRQIFIIMVILGLVGWTGMARFVRAEFLKLRKSDFVQAAIACGLPLRSILFRHILPNALTPILVNLTFGVAGAVGLESSLSYLGAGVEPPTPSWGTMLEEAGRPNSVFHFYEALTPGLLIFFTILAYNIIGEGLRDAIDPKLNKLE